MIKADYDAYAVVGVERAVEQVLKIRMGVLFGFGWGLGCSFGFSGCVLFC